VSADGVTTVTGARTEPEIGHDGRKALRVEHLTITAPGHRMLVADVDLALDRGQTLGIVGESGSGKSLTARAIVGLLPAGLRATGTVTYDGTALLGTHERTLRSVRGSRLSLLLQDPFTMLNPLQTVGAHLVESLPRDVRKNRGRAREETVRRLAEVGLSADVSVRYPFQLSGGMRQRVALAAALAKDPELLIADEPTTALDVTTQHEVLQLLMDVQQRRQMGLVLITHDLRVAFSVCDRIQVMYAGSVVEQAPRDELAQAPAHPYSLGLLLADPPVDHYLDHLVSIPGRVPPADTIVAQCGFAERCSWTQPECVAARPPLAVITPARSSACARLADIRGELAQRADNAERAIGTPPEPAPDTHPVVTITDLSKTYRTVPLIGRAQTTTALDEVSFAVREGESLGLVGETGSGKTTIARSILGLTRPDSGRIDLGGIEIADYRRLTRAQRQQVRRRVQVVFQDPYASLNPSLRIGSTLREVLARRGNVSDLPGEIGNLLARVGLPGDYAGRLPSALSGGERQRVAIARAIALQPRLLICDEPVAALDVSAQAQVLELLRAIREADGMSMLFITHDLAVVRQMTERVAVLYRGRLVESGDTASVLDRPQHEYTRTLIDAVPTGRNAS